MRKQPVSIEVTRIILEPVFGELWEPVYEVLNKFNNFYASIVAQSLFEAQRSGKTEEVLCLLRKYANEYPNTLSKDFDQGINELIKMINNDVIRRKPA